MVRKLVNKIVRIISDNDNYIDYIGIDLVVTHSSNKGLVYDDNMFPMMLLDLDVVDSGKSVPFSLYEYEVEEV